MPKPSRISIITINYNNAAGLANTMASVFEQDCLLEYLVIDGASTDGSTDVLRTHAAQLDYWISEPDTGIYNAMNKGLAQASGEYVLFLNSGDTFSGSQALAALVTHLEKPLDLIYGNIRVIGDNLDYIKSYPDTLTFEYFVEDTLPHPATLIRRELLLLAGGYDEGYKIVSDWKFFILAVCKSNADYQHVDETISIFGLDGMSSLPANRERITKERSAVLHTEFSAFLPDYAQIKKYARKQRRIRKSITVRILKGLGLLKWL